MALNRYIKIVPKQQPSELDWLKWCAILLLPIIVFGFLMFAAT